MTKNSLSQSSKQVTRSNIDCRLRGLLRAAKPSKRTIEEAIKRTGMTRDELKLASTRRHFLACERILRKRKELGGKCSMRELERKARACFRTVKKALTYTLQEIILLVRGVFLTPVIYQGGKSGDLMPFKVLATREGANFASLFSEQRSGDCSERPNLTAQLRPRSGLGGAARGNPDDATRSPILYSTNHNTGEVILMTDACYKWTPSDASPKPPGNPFLKKERSERNTAAYTARTEPPLAPMPSARREPRVQHPSAMAPLKEDEIYVPCPDDIRIQIREFSKKFSMDKAIRDTRQNRAEKNSRLTHMQRVEVNDAADEQWFRKNQGFVDAILQNRGRPDYI